MKTLKIFQVVLLVSTLFFFLQSCSDKEQATPLNSAPIDNSKLEWDENDPLAGSDIEAKEKEFDQIFTKKIEVVKDDLGNTLTFVIASSSVKTLRDFYGNTNFGLKVFQKKSLSNIVSPTSKVGASGNEHPISEDNSIPDLIFEILHTSFGDEVAGYQVTMEAKDSRSFATSEAINRYGYTSCWTSSNYIEGFQLDYNSVNCGGCLTDIRVEHWYKKKWYSKWKQWNSKTLQPGMGWDSCHDSRKTKLVIKTWSPYSLYAIPWTFWNCA